MEIKLKVTRDLTSRVHRSALLYMGRKPHTNVLAVICHPELLTRFNESSCSPLMKRLSDSVCQIMNFMCWPSLDYDFSPLFVHHVGQEDLKAEPVAESLRSCSDQSYMLHHILLIPL